MDWIAALLGLVLQFILWLLDMFPDVKFQLGSLVGIVELMGLTSCFMPWTTFILALGVWITFQNTRFIISVWNWIISKIPTIN